MSEVSQGLKELNDQKGGLKDKTKIPKFFQLLKSEKELRGRVLLTASIKQSSPQIHRELINQGILAQLEAWLSDAVKNKKFDFAKMVIGVLNQLPVGLEDLRQANVAMILMNLRKNENQALAQEAKKLVEKWKLFVKGTTNGATKKTRNCYKSFGGQTSQRRRWKIGRRCPLEQENKNGIRCLSQLFEPPTTTCVGVSCNTVGQFFGKRFHIEQKQSYPYNIKFITQQI
eukprot:TRINITY_DN7503_c0_g1_i2.p2 TRINITY_DN7503_c0_g1~~TRINITY_DN7503_c0_g1_i2.p2  ORF type:complete len:229 (-),score=27.30 TRINITY_DN7503_c0_g1_i2:25-711(-)